MSWLQLLRSRVPRPITHPLCIPVPPPRRGNCNRTHPWGSFHTKGASSGEVLASAGHTVAVFRVWGHPHSRACFVVTIMLSGRTRRLSSVDSQMSSPLSIASILLIPGLSCLCTFAQTAQWAQWCLPLGWISRWDLDASPSQGLQTIGLSAAHLQAPQR